ncbi:MAG TPA: glycosyltransferase [Acidimicrobiales bacterium]|nr:glycosyltransferase [Acidimicrobiales bacterium]
MTDDVLTESMAGPAIRAWEMAAALAVRHEVVLATTSPVCERSSGTFAVEACGPDRFAALERWCSVVVVQGYVLHHVPLLKTTDKVMVVDLYDPIFLEALELNRSQPEPGRSDHLAECLRVFGEQMTRGDFFMCASEKQRDMWVGFLAAAGRVNTAVYESDPTLRRLIDVVPFGLPDQAPRRSGQPAMRAAVPGIGPGDEVVLWGGGVYEWLDPRTAIMAVDRVRSSHPAVRLFFLGVRHPNPVAEESRALTAARELSARLGLTGTHVFFNEGWVPYERRADFLLEADVGISLHHDHVETAYSFRTRILDSIWAGLPTVATAGDTFAEVIAGEGLGAVVHPADPDAVAAAIAGLLEDPAGRDACRRRAATVAPRYTWASALGPLLDFCDAPGPAPDRASLRPWPAAGPLPQPAPAPDRAGGPAPGPGRVDRWASRAARLTGAYRRGGVKAVATGAGRALRRRI